MDISNKYAVSVTTSGIAILNPPYRLSRENALVFAAWIVSMADPGGEKFAEALNAVQST